MALGEVLVLGKVLVLVRVFTRFWSLAKVRVEIGGSVVIALGKVLVICSLGILTLRPLAKVVILALQSLQRRRRERNNNEQLRTRGHVGSKEKEFRLLAMVRRTSAAADATNKTATQNAKHNAATEDAARDAARKGTKMIQRTKNINGWNEICQRPVKSPKN